MANTDQMKTLVELLNKADQAYYNDNDPIMSDRDYDRRYEELQDMERESGIIMANSPTQRVSGTPVSSLADVTHTRPMLSCDKTKSIEKMNQFIGDKTVTISWKEDGLTLVLRYKDGKFVQAVTRGDGLVGSDVTHNIHAFRNVPLVIPEKGEVEIRGEAVIPWAEFNSYNQSVGGVYEHPRGLASGSVQKLDPAQAAERPLYFKAFELVLPEQATKTEQFWFMEENGFDVVEYLLAEGAVATFFPAKNPIQQTYCKGPVFEEEVKEFDPTKYPYPVDGLVVEYDNIAYGKILGATGHHRKCQLAFKWKDDSVKTTLEGILMQVTRTGMISFRAQFKPVRIENSTVEKATLHNLDIMESLKLGIGDEIEVFKANKIIPQVACNNTESGTFKIPTKCPVCGGPLVERKIVNTRKLFCENPNCRRIRQLEHFCSKKAANIDGVSASTLSQLSSAGIVSSPVDLYENLEPNHSNIIALPKFGERKYVNLLKAVEDAKRMTLSRFLVCLDIPGLGSTASGIVAEEARGNMNEFIEMIDNSYDFTKLDGIGEILNNSIHEWFRVIENCDLFNRLRSIITIIAPPLPRPARGTSLSGLNIVITGKINGYTRAEADDLITQNGGYAASSVTKSTDFLVVAEKPGATKLTKARQFGIPMITVHEFFDKIK